MTVYATPILKQLPPLYPVRGTKFGPPLVQNSANNAQKQQIVKVYTASGTFIDVMRDCPLMGSQGCTAPKFAINNTTGQVTITLPRKWDSFDEVGDNRGRGTIGAGNVVQFWVYDNATVTAGRLVYQGYIDAYQPSMADDGSENLQVTLSPFDTVVGDVQFIGTQNFGTAGAPATYVDPVTMFNWPAQNTNPVTGQPYTYPLTLDPGNPSSSGVTYQLQWHNQNLTSWFEAVRTCAPTNWYWRITPKKALVFQQASATPKHSFIIGRHCSKPQYQKDFQPLKNYVFVKGSGVQATAQGSDLQQFGQRTLTITEPRIIDPSTASRYAAATLAQTDQVQYRSTITVADVRGDGTALGYDIETISVGDTCRLVDPFYNYEYTLWDEAFFDIDTFDYPAIGIINQTVVISGLTYNFDSVDLELSILQPSQDRFLVDLANQFTTYTSY